jgi:hypothetical protein
MSGKRVNDLIGFALCVLVVCAAPCGEGATQAEPDGTAVAQLDKGQVAEFSAYVRQKILRSEEFDVCGRILAEKQGELKNFVKEMTEEIGISPDQTYTYETSTRSLYLLSTNAAARAGKPERTLIRKMKTESEAQYVSNLMLARSLTEQQIRVLKQLCEEKRGEFQQTDAKLRQRFKLDAQTAYRLDDQTGQIIRLKAKAEEAPAKAKVEETPAKAKAEEAPAKAKGIQLK